MENFCKPNEYLNVYDLARFGRVFSGKAKVADLHRFREMLVPGSWDEGVVDFEIKGFTDKEGWPGALLDVRTEVSLICNRCNEPYLFPIDRSVVFRFARSEEEADSLPIEEGDETEVVVGSERMKILDWVEEELLLSLPLVPRHDFDCCPELVRLPGTETEEGKSAARTEEAGRPNPFAKLKDLKGLRKG